MAPGSSLSAVYILDVQTRKTYEDVGGKKGTSQLGVSYAALLSYGSGEINVYTEPDITLLLDKIFSSHLVIGLNLKKFAFKVLSGYRKADFDQINSLDILDHVSRKIIRKPCIEELFSGTLDISREIDNMKIARQFKQGRIEEVKQITIQNVTDLNSVYAFGKQRGHVFINDATGQRWKIPVSW